jgi:hypothetical protein
MGHPRYYTFGDDDNDRPPFPPFFGPAYGTAFPMMSPEMAQSLLGGMSPSPSPQPTPPVKPQESYFIEKRSLMVDMNLQRQRIHDYRCRNQSCVGEATKAVNALILKEMLDQVQSMDDLAWVKRWASEFIN